MATSRSLVDPSRQRGKRGMRSFTQIELNSTLSLARGNQNLYSWTS